MVGIKASPLPQIYEKLLLPMNAYELSYAESGKVASQGGPCKDKSDKSGNFECVLDCLPGLLQPLEGDLW